ncbi:hypothetical protein M3Y97_00632300 [Aphelenchoides bicaudatus]|nr:hypothetical protein M3Y97_00632300 [Aphelenchoides bicaudatus]
MTILMNRKKAGPSLNNFFPRKRNNRPMSSTVTLSESDDEPTPKRPCDIVDNLLNNNTPKQKLRTVKEIVLLGRDFWTLRKGEWLNDQILNAYLELIKERSIKNSKLPKVYTFSTFFYSTLCTRGFNGVKRWTKGVDIFAYDLLLFPIHSVDHWSLVAIDLKKDAYAYFDSMKFVDDREAIDTGKRHIKKIFDYMKDESQDKRCVKYVRKHSKASTFNDPVQKNETDCGVFVCCFAENLARGKEFGDFDFEQIDMLRLRRQICYELGDGGLTKSKMRPPHAQRGHRQAGPPRASHAPPPRAHLAANVAPEFPTSAEKSLRSILNFVKGEIDPKFKRTKTAELQQQLDIELFGLSKDSRRGLWSSMQRLKLLDMICNFYLVIEKENDASKRYEYFDVIFCGREGSGAAHEHRISLLVKLCTVAIQFPCYALFDDIATWFMKIRSDVYAKRIIIDLVEEFVLAPDEYGLANNVHPLHEKSFEFSCFFIAYSVNKNTLCPQLISILGDWIVKDPKRILDFISTNQPLRIHFKTECFKHMITYDVENLLDDANHDKFHYAITHVLLQWKKANRENDVEIQNLELTILSDLIAKSDKLEEHQLLRLIQNVDAAYHAGHYSRQELVKCLQQYDNCAIGKKAEIIELLEQK